MAVHLKYIGMKYDNLSKDELVSEIKKLERDLVESKSINKRLKETKEHNQFQSSLLNAVEQAVTVTNLYGEITFWNPFAEQVYGWTAEEVLGKNINDIMVSKITESQAAEILSQLRSGKSWSVEFQAQHRNGTIFSISKTDTPIINEEGELTGIISISIDISERKKADKSLQESDERFRLTFDQQFQFMAILSPEGITIDVNNLALKIQGLQREDYIGKPFWLSPTWENNPEWQKKIKEHVMQAAAVNEPIFTEDIFFSKDGEKHTALATYNAIRDAENNVRYILTQATDITDRKKAEEDVFQNSADLNALIENTSDYIWSIDRDYKLLTANTVFLGDIEPLYNEILSIGSLLLDKEKLPPELYKEWKGIYDRVLAGNKFTSEFETYAKPGKMKSLELNYNPIINRNKEVTGVSIFGRDVTEQRLAISALRKSEHRFRLLAENAKDVIYRMSIPGAVYEYVSPASFEIFGYSPEEFYNAPQLIVKVIHPDWIEYFNIEWGNLTNGIVQPFYEYQIIHKSGDIRWVNQRNTLITDEKGKPLAIEAVVTDVTEQKQMEIELLKSKEKAEESDRLKSAFLANMSHEIRTPMNGILGFTSLLKEPGHSEDEQKKFIEIIEKSGTRMLSTINDIVDISKIEAGQVVVIISKINLNKQLDDLFEFFLPEAEKKNIKLSITSRVSKQLVNFKSDIEKLNSILTNFIKNAIKYTHSGSIEFGYSIIEEGPISELEFYVNDTGIGIPKERQQAVFNRFVQSDIEDKQVFEGSGLGLAISKAYVEMLGGKIRVESEEGIGSQFYFRVPNDSNNN